MVFRENTEGLYVMMGGNFKKGTPDEVATEIDLNTRKGVERIIRHAFEYARATGRTKVVMADKSNVLDPRARPLAARVQAGGRRVSRRSRPVHLYVDNLALQMVREPVAVPGDRHLEHVRRHRHRPRRRRCRAAWAWPPPATSIPAALSLFEPVHGSAPPLRRQERGEPHGRDPHRGADARAPGLGRGGARASRTRCAGRWTTACTTADIGGTLGTREVGAAIAPDRLRR